MKALRCSGHLGYSRKTVINFYRSGLRPSLRTIGSKQLDPTIIYVREVKAPRGSGFTIVQIGGIKRSSSLKCAHPACARSALVAALAKLLIGLGPVP